MTEFEQVLQECLEDVEQGVATVDECLSRHPHFAPQLEPILQASAYFARGREARVSEAFKARVRTRLIQDMRAHPRRQARLGFLFMRFATGFAIALLALLVTGTAYAQTTLPGAPFYAWKLASENLWRAVSPDPVGTDLAIAERRVEELAAVCQDPALCAQTLDAYEDVFHRLWAEMSPANEDRILTTLDSQMEQLNQAGIIVQQPQSEPDVAPPLPSPTVTPAPTLPPVLQTPPVESTDVPQIVPTIDLPTEIIPPVEEPPSLIPTIEIPSLIP